MTYRRPAIPRAPSRKLIRNHLAFYGGATELEAPSRREGKRGQQKETPYDKANAEAAKLLYGAILWKNRRGAFRLPNGDLIPYGLGPNGTGDRIGPTPVRITPEMVGHTVAVFTMVESKTPEGVEQSHQETRIKEIRALGGIAGFARGPEDTQKVYNEWFGRFK